MKEDHLFDSSVLLEGLTSRESGEASKYVRRKVVYIISPDPFISNDHPMDHLKFGYRASIDCARKQEMPVLSYAFKLGMFGFNGWSVRMGAFSDDQLFDMQVSQMLKSDFVAVYGQTYTESMQKLINVAKLKISRIDFRTI